MNRETIQMHAENLIVALVVAIEAQTIRDRARLGGPSGMVQGWDEILTALRAGQEVVIVPDNRSDR